MMGITKLIEKEKNLLETQIFVLNRKNDVAFHYPLYFWVTNQDIVMVYILTLSFT